MAEGRAPQTSHDPQDASYSYCFADRSDLWGPYCCGCMNDWYGGDHFRDMNTHFYLHFKRKSPHYYLPELIAVNGSLYPFIFHTSPGELKVLTCNNNNCKHKKNDSTLVEKISTGVQTRPLQDIVEKPSTSGSVPLQNAVQHAPTHVSLPTATVQPIPSKEPVPTVTQVVQPMPTKEEKAQPSEVKDSVVVVTEEEKVKLPKATEQKVAKVAQSPESHLPKKGEILRILSKTNPPRVMERRPVEFPLLYGTCYKMSSQVLENMWISRSEVTQSIYDGMKDLAIELKEAFDKVGWKTVDCDVCPLIRPDQPYVEHVLSEYHRRNLYGRGRWVTNGHFDLLDGFLRKTERQLRSSQKQGKEKEPSPKPPAPSTEERPVTPPPPTPRSLLHFPLMPMWTSRHTDVSKVSKEDFDEKIESIRGLLKSTNLQKLNEKFGTGMDPAQIMCYWCTVKVLTLSEVVNHICTWQHREKAFNRHHVTVKDLNEYLNMLRASATTKLPEKLKSPSPTLSRTTSTSSIASGASSVDPNAIKLPFLEGHTKPNQAMTRDEVISFGILVRGMLSDNVSMKKKLNEIVQNKGTYAQHCIACSKKMPSPVGVVEHSLSSAHITQIFSFSRQFCRVYDFVPMVNLLLDSHGINHPHITLKNSNIYFDMLKYSLSSQSSAQQEPRTSRKEKETVVVPFKASPVPFFSGRTQTHAAMAEATSAELAMKMQKHLTSGRDMKKSLAAVMKSMNIELESCNLCEKKFPSPLSMLEHAFTYTHINKVYSMGRTFCRQEDYVSAVQMFGKAVGISETITQSNVDKKCNVYLTMPGRVLTPPTGFSSSSSASQLSTTNTKNIMDATPASVSSGPSRSRTSSSSLSSGKLAQRSEDENITPDDTVSEGSSVKDTNEIIRERDTLKRTENGRERQEEAQPADSIPEKHEKKVVAASHNHEKERRDDSKDNAVVMSAVAKPSTSSAVCSTPAPITREDVEEAKEVTEKSTFSSDSGGSDGGARSPIEEEEGKDCLLSPTARVCRYMNERPDSSVTGSAYLTEEELATISTKVFSAYSHLRHLSSARCETEDCSFIRPLCPAVCHLCKHTSGCVCDYILHLFGSFHRKFVSGPIRTIHVVNVTFWLAALRKLHPDVPFQSNLITSDATIDWTAFAHLLPNPACTISPAAIAKFMSVNSLHMHNILTGEQLRKVCRVVSAALEGGESCWFPPVNQIANTMRAHAPNVCTVCNYKSKCVCDYAKHLFRPSHCDMLIQRNIVVSVPDVHWWVDNLKIIVPATETITALNDRSLWEGTGHVAVRYDHSLTSAEKPKECVIS